MTDTNCQRASQSLYETIAVSLFARLPPRALLAASPLARDSCSATFPRGFSSKRETARSLCQVLQSNEFNRGHPRFFDQSEADLLTKNFDWNRGNRRGRYKISSINILKRPHLFFRLCVQSTKLISHPINVFLDRQKYFSTDD